MIYRSIFSIAPGGISDTNIGTNDDDATYAASHPGLGSNPRSLLDVYFRYKFQYIFLIINQFMCVVAGVEMDEDIWGEFLVFEWWDPA